MKTCKACARNYAAAMHACPFCGAGADYDPDAPAPEPAAGGEPAPVPPNATPPVIRPTPAPFKPQMVVMGDAVPRGDGFKFPWALVLVLLIAGAAVAYSMMPKRLDVNTLEPFDPDAIFCDGHPRCVVAYIAPWCPACRTTLKMIERTRAQLEEEDIGLAVIIGNDDADRCRQVADIVGEGAWIDRGDLMLKRMDIETLPTWYRLDENLKVQQVVEGTFRPMDYHMHKLGFYSNAQRPTEPETPAGSPAEVPADAPPP